MAEGSQYMVDYSHGNSQTSISNSPGSYARPFLTIDCYCLQGLFTRSVYISAFFILTRSSGVVLEEAILSGSSTLLWQKVVSTW